MSKWRGGQMGVYSIPKIPQLGKRKRELRKGKFAFPSLGIPGGQTRVLPITFVGRGSYSYSTSLVSFFLPCLQVEMLLALVFPPEF